MTKGLRSTKRTRLATGIYQDASGVMIRIPGKPPADHRRDKDGVSYADRYAQKGVAWLREERKRLEVDATLKTERAVEADSTFRADVPRFLATINSPGHRLNTQGYMEHWSHHFADRRRNEITDIDAQTAYAAIDRADSSRIHIRRALIQFYEALNGKSGYNPGRCLTKPPKPEEPIRDIPWKDIEAMFAVMQPSKAKARLMLIAYIGLPQKQIKALHPSHLRLERRELVVHPRRKGAGVSGKVQPLSDYGVAALKEFVRIEAFGTFQNLQLVRAFHSAAKRAKVVLSENARPYDLRHSFLTEIARGGADIQQVSELGMHATIEQAARYIKGAAAERATKAIMSVPRFSATKNSQKPPIRSSGGARKVTPNGRAAAHSPGKKRRVSRGKL